MNCKMAIASRKIIGKNGASRIILKQAEFFKDKGVDVFIYTARCGKNAFSERVRVDKFFSLSFDKEKRRRDYALGYEPFCKKYKIDISVGNGDTFFQDVLFMHNIVELEYKFKNSDGYKTSTVFNIHDRILKGGNFKILINNSFMMKRFFSDKYDIQNEKSFVLYPGYDESVFNTDNLYDIKNNFKNQHNIASEFVIGFVTSGNLFKRGIDIFFDAILLLPSECLKNIKIIIVGNKKDILPFVKNDLLLKCIVILEPFERIEQVYNSIDLMVHPARIEEFGMVVLEAMACGVPVITSEQVGASEIYDSELREMVAERPTPGLLAEKILKFLSQKELCAYYGDLSEKCAKKYTWNNYMKKLLDIYRLNKLLPEGF